MMIIMYLTLYCRSIITSNCSTALYVRISRTCSFIDGGSSTLSTVAFARPLTTFGATSSSVVILSDVVVGGGLVVAVRTNVAAVSSVHCGVCCH